MYEFMTKSTAKPGVTAKALHHIKKMYSTIAKLTASDLQAGHYDRGVDINIILLECRPKLACCASNLLTCLMTRVHSMWSTYYKELAVTLEKPNKGYVKLAGVLADAAWLRWGTRAPSCTAPAPVDHRTAA